MFHLNNGGRISIHIPFSVCHWRQMARLCYIVNFIDLRPRRYGSSFHPFQRLENFHLRTNSDSLANAQRVHFTELLQDADTTVYAVIEKVRDLIISYHIIS